MKILLVNSLYHPRHIGGAELSVQAIAEGLVGAGNQIVVATLGESRRQERSTHNGVSIVRIPLPNVYSPFQSRPRPAIAKLIWHGIDTFNPLASSAVARIMVEFRPALVQTHNLAGFSTTPWLSARRLGIPILHAIHDYYLLCPKSTMMRGQTLCEGQCAGCRLMRLPQRAASATVRGVVGVSKFVLAAHLRERFFPNAAVRAVVHNGYNAPPSLPRAPADADARRRFTVGFLGSLAPVKGVSFLLQAFTRLPPDRFALQVAGAGEPEYVKGLRSAFPQTNIEFVGKVPAPDFLRGLDVLVVPSLWNEPFGRIVIEAYAHSVPVIGARVGGIVELIEEGITGRLVAPGDVASLTGAIRWFGDHVEEVRTMRDRLLLKAAEFAVAITVSRYMAVQRKVVDSFLAPIRGAEESATPLAGQLPAGANNGVVGYNDGVVGSSGDERSGEPRRPSEACVS